MNFRWMIDFLIDLGLQGLEPLTGKVIAKSIMIFQDSKNHYKLKSIQGTITGRYQARVRFDWFVVLQESADNLLRKVWFLFFVYTDVLSFIRRSITSEMFDRIKNVHFECKSTPLKFVYLTDLIIEVKRNSWNTLNMTVIKYSSVSRNSWSTIYFPFDLMRVFEGRPGLP